MDYDYDQPVEDDDKPLPQAIGEIFLNIIGYCLTLAMYAGKFTNSEEFKKLSSGLLASN